MTDAQKIAMVSAMSEEENEVVVSAYLKLAESKICRLAYPYDDDITEVPKKYELIQVEAAVYMLNKRGAEGQTSHSENGISRSYESAGLPDSLVRQIVPVCKVTS